MKLMTHIAAMAVSFSLLSVCRSGVACAQTNPLWHEEKIKNYLPHMTSPEVRDLLRKTDMALIPVASSTSVSWMGRPMVARSSATRARSAA